MAAPHPPEPGRQPEDIRKTTARGDRQSGSPQSGAPETGSGDGAAYKGGYGAGGLGSGAHQRRSAETGRNADTWDAPGVTPAGRRTGTPTDGARIASHEESEPNPPGDDD